MLTLVSLYNAVLIFSNISQQATHNLFMRARGLPQYKHTVLLPSNLYYKAHQIPNLNVSHLFFAQSIEARRSVDNEDVVGAAPTGGAPTTSEWSTI